MSSRTFNLSSNWCFVFANGTKTEISSEAVAELAAIGKNISIQKAREKIHEIELTSAHEKKSLYFEVNLDTKSFLFECEALFYEQKFYIDSRLDEPQLQR